MEPKQEFNYDQEFDYRDKPQTTYSFPDFELTYSGYLPSKYEIHKTGPAWSGTHYFVVCPKGAEGKLIISETKDLKWTSGSGELSPINISFGESKYTFFPFAVGDKPIRIVKS